MTCADDIANQHECEQRHNAAPSLDGGHRASRRRWALLPLDAPLLADAGSQLTEGPDGPWLFALLVPLLLAVVLAEIAEGGLDAKSVALAGSADCAGRRAATTFGWSYRVPAHVRRHHLGGTCVRTRLRICAWFHVDAGLGTPYRGVGPWLPFQMLAAAWLGLGAGLLPRARGWGEVLLLAAYGVIGSLLYGVLLNLWFWPFFAATACISYVAGAPVLENLGRLFTFSLVTSLGFDIRRPLAARCSSR